MQQAMASEPPQEEHSAMMLQMNNAAEAQQALQSELQQLRHSMSLLQTQSTNQATNPGYQGHGYYNPHYQQGRGYAANQGYQGRGGRGYQGRGYQGRGGGRDARRPTTRNISMYCWSHGGCGHISTGCNTPAAGHQIAATFENKMGGSTRNCT
jgi:hypothetical protein